MKQKIKELISFHKEAKEEVNFLLEDLYNIESSKFSQEEIKALEKVKLKYVEEASWRGVFISQLEDLI